MSLYPMKHEILNILEIGFYLHLCQLINIKEIELKLTYE